MIDPTYDPKTIEPRWSAAWEKSGAYAPRADGEPFSMVIPPPNVTGSLHIGHALNNTLQDVLARFERLRGKAVLWLPGLDHAGIATQMVVERQLAAEGKNMDRRAMGREAFVERVWEWKAQSGGQILNQLRRLGASCDWSRERFTLDEGLSAAVRKVFVQLYREGLIYKDKRLVNWDPHFETAISDLEVEQREIKGSLWYIRYPIEGQPGQFIVVATTRPETMLGDTGIAVHPDDERYSNLVGKYAILPLVGRRLLIIADEYSDPEKGTGAVKITPAHDFNDFEVGRRHNLRLVNVLDRRARIWFQGNSEFFRDLPHGEPDLSETLLELRGKDRFTARTRIVEMLQHHDLLEKVEPHTHVVPHGDRSGVQIEPYLTNQWYVDAKTLAQPALSAVRNGQTAFVPKNWQKTYFEWLENIQPWCVSRQLWWGHRIPVWYGRKKVPGENAWYSIEDDPEVFVAETQEEAVKLARSKYGREIRVLNRTPSELDEVFQQIIDENPAGPGRWEPIWQDEDVLDTWFSSALWPFSTLGWPKQTQDLKRFYPTTTLVTAFDIIFFWVARMMMMGLHFMKHVPFRTIYIHALVRDATGAKMSKSKGNAADPLALMDKYGADALRFTLAAMAAQGRDIKLNENRIAGYRNFGTKIWNAARFCQMNECALWANFDPRSPKETVNRWIVGETVKAAQSVTRELEAFRFNEAASAIYRFVWNVFCDWYLELIKPLLSGEDEAAKEETRRTAAWTLDRALVLLHPFMPFITEELWARLAEFGARRDAMLIASQWPALPSGLIDAKAEAEIDWIVRLIAETRSTRAELNVPPAARIPLLLIGASAEDGARLERYQDLIDRLARLDYSTTANEAPTGSVTFVLDGATIALPLAGVVNRNAEIERLTKDIAKLEAEIAKHDAKLNNQDFLRKAPEEVVEELRERRAEADASLAKLKAALERLKAMR